MLQNMEREHDAVFYHNVYKANVKPLVLVENFYGSTCSKYNKKLLTDCLI